MSRLRPCSSVVERYLGKVKAAGSIPAAGSQTLNDWTRFTQILSQSMTKPQGGDHGKGEI